MTVSALATMNSVVIKQIQGRNVTHGELSLAFDRVVNKTNWKYPIDAIVTLDEFQMLVLDAAITYFTGGGTEFAALPNGSYRVTAPGYYVLIGA